MLTVEEALRRLLSNVSPLSTEVVPLAKARCRVLAADVTARRTQPPFPASAMDGYAVCATDVGGVPAVLKLVGTAAAGHAFTGKISGGETVRIFTGAPVPSGADAVVIQEDADAKGSTVVVKVPARIGENVRKAGADFSAGGSLLARGRRLAARDLMLCAAAGHAELVVHRRPTVAILATGDELVAPGEPTGTGQIISSIPSCLGGLVEAAGGEPRDLGIAQDTLESLDRRISAATGADVLVTIGGASVGDHDLVNKALSSRGLDLAFWRIAMRPGKPLMYGRLGEQHVLGLPGNPVSASLCAQLFLMPLIRALSGADPVSPMRTAVLAEPIEANGPRQHYMRAVTVGSDMPPRVRPIGPQDSSLMANLSRSDCLIVVAPGAPATTSGTVVNVLDLEG
jgi:molybdopterin molybdotransferase